MIALAEAHESIATSAPRALAPLLALALCAHPPPCAYPAGAGDGSIKDNIAAACRLRPAEACDALETLLAGDPREDDRRSCIARLLELSAIAAPLITPDETKLVDELRARSLAVDRVLVGRYAIVLAGEEFAQHAIQGNLLPWIDLAYILERDLFAVDPVKIVGHRYLFFPDKDKATGWSIHSPTLRVSIGRGAANEGQWNESIAHEMSHGFGWYHPARELFGDGFFEGWADFCHAYVPERLAFIGAPFEGRFEGYIGAFAENGRAEYLQTRLPIEEIVSYGPSSSLLMRLALLAGDGKSVPDWRPFKKLFRELAVPQPWTPYHLWPALMARDWLRAFGERARPILSLYRFPLDTESHRELDLCLERAKLEKPPSRLERWKADGEFVLRTWKVVGPIPDSDAKHLDFDPLDAENFIVQDEYDVGGVKYRWRDDVPVDENGVVQLSSVTGGMGCCVFYLLGHWPEDQTPPCTFSIASDDEVGVWLDGQLIDWIRANRGADPDEPDRRYGRRKKGGGQILALVSNWGGPAGFHLRASPKNPFDYAWRVELRSSDPARRLGAVRYLKSRRVPLELVLDYLLQALDDGSKDVRVAAALGLAGKRNESKVVKALIDRWAIEKDDEVNCALASAVEELTFTSFADAGEAAKWWRDGSRAWKRAWYVECELAYTLRNISGGFFGNNNGAYGGQCIGRCWGGDPSHAFGLVLEARESGPHVVRLRYARAWSAGKVALHVRRGTHVVFEREEINVPATKGWDDWQWLEVPVGEIPAGRYRVEMMHADGCIDWDVMGWEPESPPTRKK